MRFKMGAMIGLMCFMGLNAAASDQITICEGNGAGGQVKLEYHEVGPNQYEALVMTYGSNDVLDSPSSIFNHMGFILFRGHNGIEFNIDEFSHDFYVTVPAFGDNLKTTEGKCRLKGMEGKFRFEVTTLEGFPISSFSSVNFETVFVHLYDAATGEQLRCNVDINIQKFEVIDDAGKSIFSVIPMCRTNLGGVLSAYFAIPRSGQFMLKAIPTARPGHFESSVQEIEVH